MIARLCLPLALAALLGCESPNKTSVEVKEPKPEATSLSGKPLFPKFYSEEVKQKRTEELRRAQANYQKDSSDLENIIWYGRRTAYLQQYVKALEIYSRGLQLFPRSARLYRHRGHRYISTRQFDKAIEDFERAAQLIEGQPLITELDGLPNKFNIPLGNTQFNIYYHWGLAHYLNGNFKEAIPIYEECLKYCNNDDLMVATVDWLYMSYRRNQDTLQAAQLLERVHPDMKIIENQSYFRRLMMYQGLESADSLLQVADEDDLDAKYLTLATQGYGVANWYYYHLEMDKARDLLQQITATDSWAAFGYIAAEADLHRLKTGP